MNRRARLRPSISIAIAFVAGFGLYAADVVVAGLLMAQPIPHAYFGWFGPHKIIALVLVQAATIALPWFLIAFVCGLGALALVGAARRAIVVALVGGLVAGQISSEAWWLMSLAANPVAENRYSTLTFLLMCLTPHAWEILPMLAQPAGLILAAWWIRRRPGDGGTRRNPWKATGGSWWRSSSISAPLFKA